MICEEPPSRLQPSRWGSRGTDADLATIVEKNLEKEPERRYASVGALAEDMERFLTTERDSRIAILGLLEDLRAGLGISHFFHLTLFWGGKGGDLVPGNIEAVPWIPQMARLDAIGKQPGAEDGRAFPSSISDAPIPNSVSVGLLHGDTKSLAVHVAVGGVVEIIPRASNID
jgi:hypothetical protein